ncbi:MAG: hypothetical protein M5T61_19850, partial [Acidimicrobiia bacterium]|nr:hypothetical protein [Acidimicrobiia bacterium]
GITLETRQNDDVYTVISTVDRNIPITSAPGWFKDFSDASTFAVLFDSRSTIPQGNINYSLVGLTPEQAGTLKGITGNSRGIPNVDADIDACTELIGDERVGCWADLDRKLMEEVVPWVPYPVGERHGHPRAGGDAVRVRPVHGRGRARARRGRSVRAVAQQAPAEAQATRVRQGWAQLENQVRSGLALRAAAGRGGVLEQAP